MKETSVLNKKILETFELLKNRPLMVVSKDDSYSLMQNYIEGYVDGMSLFLNKNLRLQITQWYQKKINVSDTHIYWTAHIPFHFAGKGEREQSAILIEITAAYFKENPDFFA